MRIPENKRIQVKTLTALPESNMIALPKGEGSDGMEQILAILDGEEAYVTRLLRYWNSQEGVGITAAAFTNEESLYCYMEKHKIGLLLCEAGIYRSMEHPPDCKTVLLSGQGYVRESDGMPVIFKFQSAQEIMDEIMGYYQELRTEAADTAVADGTMICTVCSPSGGSGVTALALALARKKSKNGRVFFLSLDPFYRPESSGGSKHEALTKAIYYIKQNSAGLKEKLNQFIMKNERLDCLCGVAHWADISECTAQEMGELLRELSAFGRYELLVIDAGGFTDAAAGCMNVSNRIVMIAGNGKRAAEKEKEFLRQAAFRDPGFSDKLIRIPQGGTEEMLEQVQRKN